MKADIVIIGAGFAGAATAYHLTRSTKAGLIIVEQEEIPGFHASGRNASLVLQSVEHPEIRQIVAASRGFYLENSQEVGYRAVGSLLLGSQKTLEKVRQPDLIPSEFLNPDEVRRRISLLEGHDFEAALLTPSDGVMDISELLRFYLEGFRRAGHELLLNCRVSGLSKRGGLFQIQTTAGTIETEIVVNAAGAWAPAIARMAGVETLPMTSFKRHLFILEGVQGVERDWPFVWSLASNFYFRPESGGLLFSVCDEEAEQDQFVQTVNPEISEKLAELVSTELPQLSEVFERRVWSCFRTKTPNGTFHLGWSKQLEGLFWIAGLGGHGMGASWEVGRRAAESILAGPGLGKF